MSTEHYCKYCKKKTRGFIINIYDKSTFKCLECKNESEHTRAKKKSAPIIIRKGGGWGGGDW